MKILKRKIIKNKLKSKLRFIVAILFIFSARSFAASPISAPSDTTYMRNPVYRFETSMHKLNRLSNPEIVMFGDSHIQSARWNELLGIYKVINRGIAGDVTEGMKNRFDEIIKLKPKVVIIEAGINDVYNWVNPGIILNNFKYFIKTLTKQNIQVVVTSVFYSGKLWGKEWIERNMPKLNVVENNRGRNKVVKEVNSGLKKLCNEYGAIFVDVNKKLSQNGFLRDAYTRDQLHLNAKGYKIWSDELLKVLKRLK